ncbi:MAG: AMP-binding protein, partial [Sphaerochaetaceae bacterium]|nr:AMP-binding protein [Sphaerochaetaceae bacterium]
MSKNYTKEELKEAPWLTSYGDVPFHLDYPDISIVSALLRSRDRKPTQTAISFQDKKWDFTQLADNIIKTAKALSALGIKKGDKVTVCMPNTPQGVY